MFENVLFLEKMGCDFWKDETAQSDIKNYRVGTHGEIIPGKDGRRYFLEFHLWRDRKKIRYNHKISGKPLKYPKYDIINRNGIAIDTEFSENGGSWRNSKLESELTERNFSYTQADVLTIVNEISTDHFNRIIFAPKKAVDSVPHILKIAGYREKTIINELTEIVMTQATIDYLVFRFYGNNGDFFDYEYYSRRITM